MCKSVLSLVVTSCCHVLCSVIYNKLLPDHGVISHTFLLYLIVIGMLYNIVGYVIIFFCYYLDIIFLVLYLWTIFCRFTDCILVAGVL